MLAYVAYLFLDNITEKLFQVWCRGVTLRGSSGVKAGRIAGMGANMGADGVI